MRIPAATLLAWYSEGIFPMGEEDGSISLYSPDPRGILDLDTFHVPKTLARILRSGRFDIRVNTAFDDVIRACAAREETWITREIDAAYRNLHTRGYAHSVEAWTDGALAGGLYGVAIGGAFFGESMFTRVRDASKAALVALVARLRARGFILLDTQWTTPHLARFGGREIPREQYLARLREARGLPVTFYP